MKLLNKAVSPLISSILLIAFAVALGVLVMSWGQTTAATTASPETCEGVSLTVIKIADKEQICYRENKIYTTVENNGAIDLEGIKANIIGDDITVSSVERVIKVAEIVKVEMPYLDVGRIKQIRLVPKLRDKVCAKDIFVVEDIEICGE